MDDPRRLRAAHGTFFARTLAHTHILPHALSFLNVTFNEFETTSSHIRLKS